MYIEREERYIRCWGNVNCARRRREVTRHFHRLVRYPRDSFAICEARATRRRLGETVLYLKRLVNLKVVMARTKDVRRRNRIKT